MKNKKLIVILSALFLLTGCNSKDSKEISNVYFTDENNLGESNVLNDINSLTSVNDNGAPDDYGYYVLKMDSFEVSYDFLNGKLKENFNVVFDNSKSNEDIEENLNFFMKYDDYKYKIKKLDYNKRLEITGTKLEIEDLAGNKNILLNVCYDDIYTEYDKKNKQYYFNTSGYFRCINYDYVEFNSVDVVINTYNKIYESNADTVDGTKLIWHFDRNNYKDKNITFVIANGSYVWYYKFRFLFGGLLVVSCIMLVTLFVINSLKNSSNKANKI